MRTDGQTDFNGCPAGMWTRQTSSMEATSERVKTPCASPVPLDVDLTTAVHTAPQSDVIACRNLVGWIWRLQLHQDRFPQPCNIKQTRTITPVPKKRQHSATRSTLDSAIQRTRFSKQPTTEFPRQCSREALPGPDLSVESSGSFRLS
jgi:hypothetical protein